MLSFFVKVIGGPSFTKCRPVLRRLMATAGQVDCYESISVVGFRPKTVSRRLRGPSAI